MFHNMNGYDILYWNYSNDTMLFSNKKTYIIHISFIYNNCIYICVFICKYIMIYV